MRVILLSSIVLALSGCGAAYKVDVTQIGMVRAGVAPTKDQIIPIAEGYIKRNLKDPDSARFDWPNDFVAGAHQPLMEKPIYGWITCGTVNAKNGFGGYTGSKAVLLVVRDGKVVFSAVETANRNLIIAGYCRLYGVPV